MTLHTPCDAGEIQPFSLDVRGGWMGFSGPCSVFLREQPGREWGSLPPKGNACVGREEPVWLLMDPAGWGDVAS